MINTNTKNESFIRLWRNLQDRGVDDSTFIFQLNNDALREYHPDMFSQIDDKEILKRVTLKVMEECRDNIWFFFREALNYNIIDPFSEQSHHIPYYINYISMCMIYMYNLGLSFAIPAYKNHSYNILPDLNVFHTISTLRIYDMMKNGSISDAVVLTNDSNHNIHTAIINDSISRIVYMNPRFVDFNKISHYAKYNHYTMASLDALSINLTNNGLLHIHIGLNYNNMKDDSLLNLIMDNKRQIIVGYNKDYDMKIIPDEINPRISKLISDKYIKEMNLSDIDFTGKTKYSKDIFYILK